MPEVFTDEEMSNVVEGSPFIFREIDKMDISGAKKEVFHGYLKKEAAEEAADISRIVLFFVPKNKTSYNLFMSLETITQDDVTIEELPAERREKILKYIKRPWKEIEDWESIPIEF